ncbi:hypothetical protein GUY44_07500 [Pimelobacter simplex]|uniref:hypothetical protein n=1 Tax=Nocardioides simplex TaxID=2045 RepID=UPI0011424FCD|nr:hypothetical protein [Pimelobacter simplex]MCG8150319.1 hypothetical protein [Pimelobacter simplex]
MSDVWNDQDLPVLRAAVEALDEDPDAFEVTAEHLADAHLDGITEDQARASLKRLVIGGYLEEPSLRNRLASWTPGESVVGYSERALRAVGTWPTTEVALERLVAALTEAAEQADDPEVKSSLKSVAKWIGSTATNVGASIAATVITGGM